MEWTDGGGAEIGEQNYDGEVRERVLDCDILLFRGRGFSSWLIRLISKSRYSHVGLVVREHDRVLCADSTSKGVRLTTLRDRVQKYDGGIDHFELKPEVTAEQREAILRFIFGKMGKGYDNFSALVFALVLVFKMKKRTEKNDKWFCSELIAAAFDAANIERTGEQRPEFISPGELATTLPIHRPCTLKW